MMIIKTYTVRQISEMLNTNPETVRRWIRDKKLNAAYSIQIAAHCIRNDDMLFSKKDKRKEALQKECDCIAKKEAAVQAAALKAAKPAWKVKLEEKVPKKVADGLQSAFAKGFCLVFEKGTGIIEKTYDRNAIQQDYAIADFAVQVKGGRRELKKLRRQAQITQLGNLTITAAEGIGLGVLGVGLPDVVLFIGILLKGIYETALCYGFSYDSLQDRYLILKMIEASLSTADAWLRCNQEVDQLLAEQAKITEQDLQAQIQQTAAVLAMDMLLLKFVQGFPVAGIIGGAANPIYYNKVMRYVQLKYNKRYLFNA